MFRFAVSARRILFAAMSAGLVVIYLLGCGSKEAPPQGAFIPGPQRPTSCESKPQEGQKPAPLSGLVFDDSESSWRHILNDTEKTSRVAGKGEPSPSQLERWATQGTAKAFVERGLGLEGLQGFFAAWALEELVGEAIKGEPDFSQLDFAPANSTGDMVYGVIFSFKVDSGIPCTQAARQGSGEGPLDLAVLVRTQGGYTFKQISDNNDSVNGWAELRFPWWKGQEIELQVYDVDPARHDAIASFRLSNPYNYYELTVDGARLGKIGFLSKGDVSLMREKCAKTRCGAAVSSHVKVTAIADDSQAASIGLVVGDLIEAYDGQLVDDLTDLNRAIAANSKAQVELRIRRGARFLTVKLKPGKIGIYTEVVYD